MGRSWHMERGTEKEEEAAEAVEAVEEEEKEEEALVYEGCPPLRFFLRYHLPRAPTLVMRGCAKDIPAFERWQSDVHLAAAGGDWCGSDSYHARNTTLERFAACYQRTPSCASGMPGSHAARC